MKIEEQVLSIEQMKHLQELGVDTSDASMCWIADDSCINFIPDNNGESEVKWNVAIPSVFLLPYRPIPTYTIGDLIEKLPKRIDFGYGEYDLEILISGEYIGVQYTSDGDYTPLSYSKPSLIESLYSILCGMAKEYKKLLEAKK